MASPTSPFMDHAAPILAGEPSITDAQRADLWDTFHASKSPDELNAHLQTLAVPDDLKKRLTTAKQISMPAPIDRATAAMTTLSKIDPQVLELAESHPNVLKVLTAAAMTPDKPVSGASDESSTTSRGRTPKTGKTPPPVTLDAPVTPPGHVLIHGGDGNVYHLPVSKMDMARKLDPQLKVLHAEPDEA